MQVDKHYQRGRRNDSSLLLKLLFLLLVWWNRTEPVSSLISWFWYTASHSSSEIILSVSLLLSFLLGNNCIPFLKWKTIWTANIASVIQLQACNKQTMKIMNMFMYYVSSWCDHNLMDIYFKPRLQPTIYTGQMEATTYFGRSDIKLQWPCNNCSVVIRFFDKRDMWYWKVHEITIPVIS